jgi:hypothetical protein
MEVIVLLAPNTKNVVCVVGFSNSITKNVLTSYYKTEKLFEFVIL